MHSDDVGRAVESALRLAVAAADRDDWQGVIKHATYALENAPDNKNARRLLNLARGDVGAQLGPRFETLLFADLKDSTKIAEEEGPVVLARVYRAFELSCTPVFTGLGGHVVRFAGDGFLVTFGFPVAHEDDARRAVEAGLDIVEAVAATAERFEGLKADLEVKIGLASGLVVHLDRGIRDSTQPGDVVGKPANEAARIQNDPAARYGQVQMSPTTAALVGGYFQLEDLGSREYKGIRDRMHLSRAVGRMRAHTWIDRRRRGLSPLFGRAAELAALARRWADAAGTGGERQPVAVLVTGEPGVGKSRVVRESLAARHPSIEPMTVELYCEDHRSAIPLFPVREAIERHSGIEAGDDDATRLTKLAATLSDSGLDPDDVIPCLLSLLEFREHDGYAAPEISPAQLREVTLGHLASWITALAARRPTSVVIEDLHWADPTTTELVQRVVTTRTPGLMVVATSRVEPTWTSDAGFESHVVKPLNPDDTLELARSIGADTMTEEELRALAAESDGIPLFVEHLADAVSGGTTATVPNDASRQTPPITLVEVLQARLDSVGSSKQVAQIAATMGREFDLRVVNAAIEHLVGSGDMHPLDRSVDEHVDRLVAGGLVELDPAERSRIWFRHALVAEAAYESQFDEDRRARHLALADVLADEGQGGRPVDPAVLALHYDRADRPDEAIPQYLAAAQALHQLGAYAELLQHLGRAEQLLARLDRPYQPPFELAIRLSRGLALGSTGGYVASIDEFARAVEVCESLRDVELPEAMMLRALLGLWTHYCVTTQFDRSTSLCEEMERHLLVGGLAGARGGVLACRGAEAFFMGDLGASERYLEQARSALLEDDIDLTTWPLPNDPLGAVLVFLGLVRMIADDAEGARAAVAAGLERSRALAFPLGTFTEAFIRNYEAWMHRLRGDLDAARSAATELLHIGERHGFYDWQMCGPMQLAAIDALDNPTAQGLVRFGDAIAPWQDMGGRLLLPTLHLERGWGYIALGDDEVAASCLQLAEELMAPGQFLSRSEAHRLRAELLGRSGADLTAVLDELVEGLTFARNQPAPLFVRRCQDSLRRWARPEDVRVARDEVRLAVEEAWRLNPVTDGSEEPEAVAP